MISGLMLFFVGVLFIFGGSSDYKEYAQLPVRLVAISVITISTFASSTYAPRGIKVPAILLGLVISLVFIQLIPLPPAIWTALPGRSEFGSLARIAGFPQPWRPIAINPDLAANALIALTVPAAALYGLTVMKRDSRRWIFSILLVIILGSLLVCLAQLATGSGGFTGIYQIQWHQASGIFTNRNHQALLLAIGIPLLAGWDGVRRGGRRGTVTRWGVCAVVILLVITIIAMGSRAGLLLGGIGILGGAAVVRSWMRRRDNVTTRRSGLVRTVVLAAILALTIGVAVFFGRGQAIDRLIGADPLGDRRAEALPTVIDITLSYLPIGSGFGSFDTVFRRAEPFQMLQTTYFNEAHNDLLQIVLEGGVPGLILLISALIWLGIMTARVWGASSAHGPVIRGRAASVAMWMITVASALDYALRTPIMMATACALTFLVVLALEGSRQPNPTTGS